MIQFPLSLITHSLNLPKLQQDAIFKGISIDTRTLLPGNLFVAIQGERVDGHQFAKDALNKGAAALLVNHAVPCNLPQLVVKDTLLTLGQMTALWRDQFKLPLVGVTGSNGKTTLKNMITAILTAATENPKQVLSTEGNLNNNIGLPLTLARLDEHHRFGVIEMGMNHLGEIEYLTKLTKPFVAIVNNAAPAHIAQLKNVEGVARAKGEIFLGLLPNGFAILNKDDAFYNYWYDLVPNHQSISFGLLNSADITASISSQQSLVIHTPGGNFPVTLKLLGRHNVMNALAATAASLALQIDLETIQRGLESVHPAKGRLREHCLPNGLRIIDDTYNANPASVHAAINTLATLSGTKILVLGDMKELGPEAEEFHAQIGQKAHNAGINYLFTLGDLSYAACKRFGKNAFHFTDRDSLLETLSRYARTNTTLLIKGSRGMTMEKIVHHFVPDIELEH